MSSEKTSQKVKLSQLPQLDGLRAVCLISIIIHHWTVKVITFEFPFEIGAFVFFSLSGYLITRILLRSRNKLNEGRTTFSHLMKSFIIRRVLRLAPVYLVALSLYVIAFHSGVIENFIWYITNSSNIFFAMNGKWSGGADQFWTLAVDQQFYFLWPFIILFTPRRALPIVIFSIALIAPLSRHLSYYDNPLFTGPMKDKLPWFLTDHLCLGALLALYHEKFKRLPGKLIMIIGLLISLVIYLILRYELFHSAYTQEINLFQQTVLAIFSTCLVSLCASNMGGTAKKILEHPTVQYIGKRSYGYYVYHNLVFIFLGKIGFFLFADFWNLQTDFLFPVRIIAATGILYLMAHYSWKYIEEPLMRRKEQHKY